MVAGDSERRRGGGGGAVSGVEGESDAWEDGEEVRVG